MDIYYQIANCAFVEGHVMPVDDEHGRHAVIDVCQQGNRDRVDAVIAVALDELALTMEQALRRPLACEYIVCRVMADWLSITKPGAAARWSAKARDAMEAMGRRNTAEGATACFCRPVPF